MRRTPVAAASTAAGLAAVVALHLGGGKTKVTVSAAPPASSAPAAAGASPPTTVRSSSQAAGSGANGAGTSSTPGGATTTTTTPGGVRSAEGAAVQYGYGVLAVKVTVEGKRITSVSVPTLQTAESYSTQLAHYAFPTLSRQVLAAQSANISGVSGATYTSEAYARSVQSALGKLHL